MMLVILATLACADTPSHLAASNGLAAIQARAKVAGLTWPLEQPWVHIDKSDRQLRLMSATTVVHTYRVGLGGAPQGDKVARGDSKTPTGTFRVVTRNPQSNFHLFLGINYPNAEHATRGLKAGLISEIEATAIREADAALRPAWDTRLGGQVGIHGGGSSSDWTLGCIAVSNAEIEELWNVVKIGTKVVIEE